MSSIPILNQVATTYADRLLVFAVYTVEAHPNTPDLSPYSGTVWPTPGTDGNYYNQPLTYGERKTLVATTILNDPINAPVLIDGPCNEWWNYYTNSPNNSILMDSMGVIFSIHREFDDFHANGDPADIYCDVDSLLGYPTGCGGSSLNGTFDFSLDAGAQVFGSPGLVHSVHSTLQNSGTEDVFIRVVRLVNHMPAGWSSQVCTNQVCYDQFTDTAFVYLNAGETGTFTMYFNTSMLPDTGRVKMEFTNLNIVTNTYTQNFRCITQEGNSSMEVNNNTLSCYPNPFKEKCYISLPGNTLVGAGIQIFDFSGKLLQSYQTSDANFVISGSDLNTGMYYLMISRSGKQYTKKLLVQ
jgi:hypothetical protein